MLVLDNIRRTITRYSMLVPGQRLAVAVSGGADSVALLAALRELAPALGVTLAVAHVNHGLRGAGSDEDQRFVTQLAQTAGLPWFVRDGPVEPGENVEQSAREQRRAFFFDLVTGGRVDRVATAHTEDDQAETVMLRLLRGSGTAGLAAILPTTSEGLIRPALDLSRAELRGWAAARGETWREDQTNADVAFARNRMRHQLLPQLEQEWNPALKPLLAQTAQMAREDAAYLDRAAGQSLGQVLAPGAYGSWILPIRPLRAEPLAMQRRWVRGAIQRVRGDLRQIDYHHVDRVLALAGAGDGDGRLQVPGVDVFRSFDWLRFGPWPSRSPVDRNWRMPVTLGQDVAVEGGLCRLAFQSAAPPPETCAYNVGTDWLDVSAISLEELELRNWRPGDRFRQEPEGPPEKVKLLFQQGRIPLWERRNWPMVTRKDEILWALGLGVSAGYSVSPASVKCLGVQVIDPAPSAVNMRICLNQKDSVGRL